MAKRHMRHRNQTYLVGAAAPKMVETAMKREYWKQMDQRMFDFQVVYETMADLLPQGCRVVEVGVADGASSIYLLEHLLNKNKNPNFWMVDSLAYGGAEQLNEIMRNLGKAKLFSKVQLLPIGSLDASCRFPDQHLDFVFIDASHTYEATKADIRLWHRKVKHGGALGGHDYNTNEGVRRAVDETIPKEYLRILPTEQGHGAWWIDVCAEHQLLP